MKAGWKTTEFWMHILAQLVSGAAMYIAAQAPTPTMQLAAMALGVAGSTLSAKGYVTTRTTLKTAEMGKLPPFLSGNPP